MVGAVALALASCDGVGESEQARIEGTRLTSPFIEAPGEKDGKAEVEAFRREVERYVTGLKSTDTTLSVSVYLRDLEQGSWTGVDENEPYVPASLMKVAVLFHALYRLEADPSLASVMIRYPGPDSMPSPDNLEGEPPPQHMVAGESYRFDELVERMVTHSDNHAKDLVMRGVRPAEVDRLMQAIGVPTIDEAGREVMTARAYSALFRMLYHSSVFARGASERALDYLSRADFDLGLRAGLPSNITVASKYGVYVDPRDRQTGQQLHECGIVYLPERPVVLCVMTRSRTKSIDDLAAIVATVAGRAYDALPRKLKGPVGT